MIDLKYSLVIEATDDPEFFGFYSPELEGFSGTGSSIEDCLLKAREAMDEHVALLKEQGLTVPTFNRNPVVTVKNSQQIAPAA
ncbi:MAG TPA: type II toxin-antitoxin system HicB family antitoxin [Pyrinomonadaceae bacterium]